MKMFGIITTSDEIGLKGVPGFIYNKMPKAAKKELANLIIANFKKNEYEYIDFSDIDIQACVARLPFTQAQLSIIKPTVMNKFCKEIIYRFKEQGIDYIVLPQHIRSNRDIYEKIYISGQFYYLQCKKLLMSLIIDILKKICKIVGKDMTEIDIGIAENRFSQKSQILIQMLSVDTKYITFITQDLAQAQGYMEKICDETGLTVRVSENIRKSLRNIDVIFVLDDFESFIKRTSIHPSTVVFNLDENASTEEQTNILKPIINIVIDSLDIIIPQKIAAVVAPIKGLNKAELVACIIALKKNKNIPTENVESYIEENKEFYNLGCKINALKGYGTPIDIHKLEKIVKNFS
ncbi:MAG: hypothetical protein PWP27_1526 [Clostridiales bacterium]|jgi:hypothetical protein|nr:hypothetical protein [Clostridiales bacterium]MDK2933716.1 hypothetical protein [Clostridiales bacterium]